MIINDKDAAARLNSPLNLINKLHERKHHRSAMDVFTGNGNKAKSFLQTGKPEIKSEEIPQGKAQLFNPFEKKTDSPKSEQPPVSPSNSALIPSSSFSSQQLEEPNLDKLLDNAESNIKLGLAHDKAVNLLHDSLEKLSEKLDQVQPAKLSAVISAASKTVESIRRERNEAAKSNKGKEVHYHFYTPTQRKLSDYEVIEVEGTTVNEVGSNG